MTSIQEQAQKNFLFYSNYCHHSKRLLTRIQSTNLVNNLNIICIDNPEYNIPNFIEVVPTLYDPVNRRVIVNDELFNWIEGVLGGSNRNHQPQMGQPQMGQPQMNQNANKNDINSMSGMNGMGNGVISMQDITGDENILAFQKNEMLGSGGVGSSYAFINDGDNDNLNRNFSYLDDNKDVNIMPRFTKANDSIPDSNNSGNSKQQGSAISSAYDKMLAERQNEMNNSMSAMRV